MCAAWRHLLGQSAKIGSRFQSTAAGQVKYNFDSKVALVTASTDGIGLAIARKFAQNGASVIVSSRKQANVEKTVQDLHAEGLTKVVGQVCHVGNAEDRAKLVQLAKDKFGGVDIFVSNAATNPAVGPILDTEESVFDKIFEINVKAAFLLTKDLVPLMKGRPGDKSIIYVSSIAGYNVMPAISTYSVSKTTLLGLTKAVAANCAEDGIRVNCVCPGIIQTRFSSVIWQNPIFKEEFERQVLIKRVGQPEEIAGTVAYLASADASYVTGESFVTAGGYYSRL